MPRLNADKLRLWLWPLSLVVTAFALAYAYLFPLSEWMVTGREPTKVIGNGLDDIQGLVWSYRAIVRTLHEHPTWYFYGAIHTDLRNVPEGSMLWVPWVERIFVPLVAPFTTDASIVTAMNMVFYLTSFAAMYLYAAEMKWSRPIALAAAIAFAFSPFARVRASVHPAFVAVYFLPLLFWAIERVAREGTAPFDMRRWKWPALMLLLVGTSSHYYLLITIFLSPFLLMYALSRARTFGVHRLVVVARLAACSVPLVLFLAWNFLAPVPPGVTQTSGKYPTIDHEINNHYLHTFSALPIDYVTQDLDFDPQADIIVPRRALGAFVVANGPGNPHERTNGIRWSVFALAVPALLVALAAHLNVRRKMIRGEFILLLALVALYGFAMSMGPQWLVFQGKEYGPSQFAMKIFPNLRVASRWGPVVNFGVVCVAMAGVSSWSERLRPSTLTWRQPLLQAALWIVPLCVVGEYLPRARMMFATLAPIPAGLPLSNSECGAGVLLPHVHNDVSQYERMRGTPCRLLSPDSLVEGGRLERHLMGSNAVWRTPMMSRRLVDLVQCTGASWIAFRPELDADNRRSLCAALGWSMVSDQVCRTTTPPPSQNSVANCVP